MIGPSTARQLTLTVATIAVLACGTADAFAQNKPRPRPAPAAPRPSNRTQIGGYAMFGNVSFTAAESFDAIIGTASGPIFGGGVRISEGGVFLDVGAWRYSADGERAFVFNDEIFKLGIPVTITITPIELSGGWRFRFRKMPKLTPYAAGGLTLMKYRETSEFSAGDEDVNETFKGFHVSGGAEYRISRWFGAAGEVSWTTVPDAIGESGVSKAFNDTDLGGTTFRVKVTIGR